jgi:hypothetical protein
MRKAWVFLVVLAMVALSMPVFADDAAAPAGPTVKFSMSAFWWLNIDPNLAGGLTGETANSGSQRVWPTADVAFDPNNTLEIGLRIPNGTSNIAPTGFDLAGSLWHFMWTSDLTGAMGLKDSPVDVKVTIGLMDSVLTNWWYDNNGWEWEYGAASKTPGTNWDAQLVTINGDSNFLGYGLAVGVGPVILHWVNDFSLKNTLVGAEASVMGLGVYVAYGVYDGVGNGVGDLSIEAKYDVPQMGDLTLKPSAFFRDQVYDGGNWVGGLDVTVGYTSMFKVIVGATTTNTFSLEHYSATFHVMPLDPADLWLGLYLDGATPDSAPLQAVDIGASYKFGAFKLIVGYVIGGADQTKDTTGTSKINPDAGNFVTLGNDNVGRIANGFYVGSAISF